MGLISTGFKITKTIRNIGRLREISTIFAKHGFDEILSQGVLAKIPGFVLPTSTKNRMADELAKKEESSWAGSIGYRLRLCFEELGPAFVKFGQLLSSREDIFDEDFIEQMQLLRDKVSPLPFSKVRASVEESLEKKIEDVFEYVNETPIGTASIGLVYDAKLKTGEKVVLKVKRPGIDKLIETDLSILIFIATQSERAGDEVKYLGPSKVIEDFAVSLQNELNFNIESLNCERLRKIISKYDEEELFYLPKVYKQYTSESLLVMELIEGIPFSDKQQISGKMDELEDKLNKSVHTFLKTFLNEGFFHADLHGGNFFYTSEGKIALIDFGLVGSLSRTGRQNFLAIIYSLLTYNFESLVYEFLDVADYEGVPDVDRLISDIKYSLGPYIGLTVQQTNFSVVFRSIVKTLREHQILLPREWFIVFRAMMTLDGVGKSLGMDFDLFAILEKDVHGMIKENFKKEVFIEDALWVGRDILNSSRMMPRHLRWFFKEWSKNNYAFEVKHQGHEKSFDKLASSIQFLGICLVASVLFFAGMNMVDPVILQGGFFRQIPIFTYLLWFVSFVMVATGYSKKNRG